MTSNELCQAIYELSERHYSDDRTLEQYLLALVGLTRPLENKNELLTTEFYGLLSDAFDAPPIAFDESWNAVDESSNANQPGFRRWLSTAIRQIVDLCEMDACGTLADQFRWGGVDSPRGNRWFNFEPAFYLECAIAGTGWDEFEQSPEEMPKISWEMFETFLDLGRLYE